ncbi:hypothetical protein BDY21DRAFT_335211 [Lineolata rhizophorae]|uniref:Uncharacterized protein n=1 Tax=Lineolata rhizophorae TaxID=578093 RepID=A0A6A6P917_9PEZI|nr:hypothetical protein BDY21DRAFT_335211 [Lineolata rhizophorae]
MARPRAAYRLRYWLHAKLASCKGCAHIVRAAAMPHERTKGISCIRVGGMCLTPNSLIGCSPSPDLVQMWWTLVRRRMGGPGRLCLVTPTKHGGFSHCHGGGFTRALTADPARSYDIVPLGRACLRRKWSLSSYRELLTGRPLGWGRFIPSSSL